MHVVLRRTALFAALLAPWLLAPAAAVRAQDGAAGKPAKEDPAAPVAMPVDMDGVLLTDGRQIEGGFKERAGQRWLILPKGGGPELNVSVTQIVIAEKGGEIELLGEDSAAAKVWRAAIRSSTQKLAAGEAAVKAAQIEGLEKGVAWCTKRGFATAATSMLTEIGKLDSAMSADVAARAKALMPAGFFFKDAPDAVAQWMRWADALLPSSAQFVGKDDEDAWKRLENKPWTDGATLCFRTANVLMFMRDMEPAVCATALRLAEQTVRVLQVFLHDGEPDVVSSDSSRLEIRIHKSRADYLAEEPARGQKAGVWTAGYFNPRDGVSHFYVDRTRTKTGGADIAALTRVLTHEFTHHYMTGRWAPGFMRATGAVEMAGGPGFWVVEGMAEFVQHQFDHMGDGEPRFDNDNVLGNDATAQARKANFKTKYLAMETFIDMTQSNFQSLSDEPLGMIKLTRSKGAQGCTERTMWYDQAGALTYFFLQKKGPEMRKKFVRYVSDHYAGNSHVPAWTYFGYSSAQELDNDFAAFLRQVGG